jgi:hypothetical protein
MCQGLSQPRCGTRRLPPQRLWQAPATAAARARHTAGGAQHSSMPWRTAARLEESVLEILLLLNVRGRPFGALVIAVVGRVARTLHSLRKGDAGVQGSGHSTRSRAGQVLRAGGSHYAGLPCRAGAQRARHTGRTRPPGMGAHLLEDHILEVHWLVLLWLLRLAGLGALLVGRCPVTCTAAVASTQGGSAHAGGRWPRRPSSPP